MEVPLSEQQREWVRAYEAHELERFGAPRKGEAAMSRSNPTDGVRNPSTRWFEWAGSDEAGYIRWYDKEAKEERKVEGVFTFLVLDELSTVKGWHEASKSGIYANEVRDTRQDVLVVKSFKGGEIASGFYAEIKERVKAKGGSYATSIYIAFKDGNELRLGNLSLRGAAGTAWMDFKKECGSKKDANGKAVRAYYIDAVKIDGYSVHQKGKNTYRIPVFALAPVSETTNAQAAAIDVELQAFLAEYLKRPKGDAAKPHDDARGPGGVEERAPAAGNGSKPAGGRFDDFEDDIPF